MEKPLPFLIIREGNLELNQEVINIISKSLNPRLLLFYGATRVGKSTTLNQIIRGNIDTWKYINKKPFKTQTSQSSLTEGCDIYGPIRCSEIKRRHNLNIEIKEDFDIFFCDTEGLYSLNEPTKSFIPGILTLLQVSSLSVIMTNQAVNLNTVSQFAADIQFSKILQKVNKDLQAPLVAIFVSGFLVDIAGKKTLDDCLIDYSRECKKISDEIDKNIRKKYPNMEFERNKYYKVIPGGPYQINDDSEPKRDDLKAILYWKYINEIPKLFIDQANKYKNYGVNKLISLIKIIFNFFKNFTELPRDVDIKGALIQYLKNSFNKFSNEQFYKINEEIKKDLKNNYEKYYRMLIDKNTAEEKLNQCIEKEKYEIYILLIPEDIDNFMEKAYLKLINAINNQFEEEFKIKNKIITSEDYIMAHIKGIIDEINKANFQEDINMNIVNSYIKIWSLVEKENEGLFIFFREKKPNILENLKKNFNNSIEKIVKNLISGKIIWKKFYEKIKAYIKDEINIQYIELYRKVQYQEDFDIIIKSYEILSKELYEKYNEKYFKKLIDEKKYEIKIWIKQACESEYNKLKIDNLKKEKWLDEKNNIKERIKEKINNYINSIFNGKYFRNEINPNLGKEDVIKNIIKDINIKKEISNDKKQEIYIIKNEEIKLGISLFNYKREQLPLFEDILLKKEKMCIALADNKIKELLSQFNYAEDKIKYSEDNFYSLFKKNEEINLNIPQNNAEFEYMIRNISSIKSNEYNNIKALKKPFWSDIKQKKKIKIENQCHSFIKEVLNNKSFKQEIEYDINILIAEINSLNLFNGIDGKKYNEINELIKNKIQETKQLILIQTNSLSDWSIVNQLKINEGKDIMNSKLNNLNPKELTLNYIKQILLEEVLTYPRFVDIFTKKEKFYNKLIDQLDKIAGEMANDYIIKKKKELEEQKKYENTLKEIFIQAENEAKQRIELQNKITELQNEINQLRQRPEPQPQPQQQQSPPCFPIPNYGGGSIVDALKSIGANSSYDYRCRIAARNGIGGGDYQGRPHENIYMLQLLREGRLIIP